MKSKLRAQKRLKLTKWIINPDLFIAILSFHSKKKKNKEAYLLYKLNTKSE